MQQKPILISVQYPSPDFNITTSGGKQLIWDPIRKKRIVLTPEEWVRQNFIQYLIQVKKYPSSLLSVEKQIKIGELSKRYDIVVYQASKPWMIVECKEGKVQLNEKTLRQILNYNMTLKVPYLVLTNGAQTFGIHRTDTHWTFLNNLPNWE